MKTYAEKEGSKPFDWFEFLNRKTFVESEWNMAERLSASWTTCACGNQCWIIPRKENGEPCDDKLVDLGGVGGFHGAIKDRNPKKAISFLKKIEKRSQILINQIKKELL